VRSGRPRLQKSPGQRYSSIGTGTHTDDQRIYWPRVVMCVPRAVGARVYMGHLRLEGARYEEEVKLSTGKLYTSRRHTLPFPGG
jgi:hypothetical protein